MSWPLPNEFNEAVQNPAVAFTDPDLKAARPVVGPQGTPLVWSGNFADVYQLRPFGGKDWAVKCFTRPVTGLDERYQKVGEALAAAKLPFTIGFQFLTDGVLVRGEWRPVVKMEWVDGLLLNQFVRENAAKPAALDALFGVWVRLSRRLRELGIAHADLQHANVLLVAGSRPGAFGVKLIDYDGMYVPALATRPSGEAGHPNYQHPTRASGRVYSPDLDRFPHLVIATALKAVSKLGPPLWEKYDTGDNLLFTADDFKDPGGSKLMRELWEAGDRGLAALVGSLAVACTRPIPQTPWLDHLAPDGTPMPLGPGPEKQAADALAVPVPVAPSGGWEEEAKPKPTPEPLPIEDEDPFAAVATQPRAEPFRRAEPPAKSGSGKVALIVGGLLLAAGAVVAGVVALGGKKKPDETAGGSAEPPANTKPDKPDRDRPETKTEKKDRPKGGAEKQPSENERPKPPVIPPTTVAAGNFDPAGAQPLFLAWQATLPGMVRLVRFTPDGGALVATEQQGPTIHVFDARTGAGVRSYTQHTAAPLGIAPFRQGLFCSAAADEPQALIWHPTNPRPKGNFPLPPDTYKTDRPGILESSPGDGRYIALGHPGDPSRPDASPDGLLKLFDNQASRIKTLARVRRPKCVLTADELLVADVNTFRWYSLATAAVSKDVPLPYTDTRRVVAAVSPDASKVLYSPDGTSLKVLDSRTGQVLNDLPERFRTPEAGAAFSPDGRLLAVPALGKHDGDPGTRLEVLDLATNRVLGRVVLNPQPTLDAVTFQFSPDGTTVAAGRSNRLVQVFRVPGAAAVAVKPPDSPENPVMVKPGDAPLPITSRWVRTAPPGVTDWNRLAITRDGRTVVVGGASSKTPVSTFDARTGAPGPDLPVNRATTGLWIDAVTSAPLVATSGHRDAAMTLWETRSGRAVDKLLLPDLAEDRPGPSTQYLHKASPDGRFTVRARQPVVRAPGGAADPTPFRLADARTGRVILSFDWVGGSAFFTSDGGRVLVLERTGRGRWFRLPAGTPDGEWRLPEPERVPGSDPGVALSADGRVLLCAGGGAGVTYYTADARTGQMIRPFAGSFHRACGDLTPDGRYALLTRTVNGVRQLVMFDAATGATAGTVPVGDPGRAVAYHRVAVSADGKTAVVTAGGHAEAFSLGAGGDAVAANPPPKNPGVIDPPAKDPPPVARQKVPPDDAVAKAEAVHRDVFKDDFAKKSAADRAALAKKLIRTGEETNDNPVARYALLRDAREVGVEAGDPAVVALATDAIARYYEVDGPAMKVAALEKIMSGSPPAAALRAIHEYGLAGADAAADADDTDTALRLAQLAAAAARRGNLPGTALTDAELRVAHLKRLQDTAAAVRAALDALKANPDDPAANTAVGRFRCFAQGRWDDGVKLLAKGDNAALKAVANLELAQEAGPADVKLADAWWDYVQTAADGERRPAEYRARYWYHRAVPGLTGLMKAKAEGRLGFTAGATEYRPGLVAEFIALRDPSVLMGKRGRVDTKVEFSGSEFEGGSVTPIEVKWTGVVVPPRAGRYKLIATSPEPTGLVRVKVGGKAVIDTTVNRNARKEGAVTLPDRPTPVVVEYFGGNAARFTFKLTWVPPGGAEEPIPLEAMFHDKKAAAGLK
jgi:WD40 repeat protein